MFAKSTQIGLVSLFVVLATALGGCSESVGSVPANAPIMTRPALELSRFSPRVLDTEGSSNVQIAKAEPIEVRAEGKRVHTVADVR
jgi:hypothetical protein